jgi:hypothetical protein
MHHDRRGSSGRPLAPPPPVVLAYGIGVDSTALLIEARARRSA